MSDVVALRRMIGEEMPSCGSGATTGMRLKSWGPTWLGSIARVVGRLSDGTAEVTFKQRLAEEPLRKSLMSHTLRRMQRPDQKHLHIIRDDQLPTFWSGGNYRHRLNRPIT